MVTASELRDRVSDGARRRLGIDTRTLAAFRVALGVVVLVNLAARTRDLTSFYTAGGVLPNAAVQEYTTLSRYSLYALSDSVVYVSFLFIVTAAFAVALVVGYRTHLASAAVFVLVFSLNARNPLVMNGGDALLTRLLFWTIFLPLGARWSVDARRRDGGKHSARVTGIATVALLTQVVVVYVANAVFKLRSVPWMSGEAVHDVFGLTAYTTPLGSFLANFPELLVLLNYAWITLLVVSPLLLVLTEWRRAALASAFAVCHLGLFVTMNLTVFPLVSVVGLVVFTPPSVWDTFERTRLYGPLSRFGDAVDHLLPRLRLKIWSPNASPKPSFTRWQRRAVSLFVGVCLVTVLVTNAAAMGYVETEATEQVEEYVGYKWSLFAPYPPTTDRWYVFRGETDSGEFVDPLRLSSYEVDLGPDPYPNARWRKYLSAVRSNDNELIEGALSEYLCKRWNRRNNDELAGFEGYFVVYKGTTEKSRFMRGDCDL